MELFVCSTGLAELLTGVLVVVVVVVGKVCWLGVRRITSADSEGCLFVILVD